MDIIQKSARIEKPGHDIYSGEAAERKKTNLRLSVMTLDTKLTRALLTSLSGAAELTTHDRQWITFVSPGIERAAGNVERISSPERAADSTQLSHGRTVSVLGGVVGLPRMINPYFDMKPMRKTPNNVRHESDELKFFSVGKYRQICFSIWPDSSMFFWKLTFLNFKCVEY